MPTTLQWLPRRFDLMTALSPAFVVVDWLSRLNLNLKNRRWVQYGTEECQDLLNWVVTSCNEFRGMKIVKYARYVGTMI